MLPEEEKKESGHHIRVVGGSPHPERKNLKTKDERRKSSAGIGLHNMKQ